jgi:hypothetical protein
VNGLEDEFGRDIDFIRYNASDGEEGTRQFEALNLPGHPSILLYDAEGREILRFIGIPVETLLRDTLIDITYSGNPP